MKKWIAILSVLLVAQLALALALNITGEDYDAYAPQGKLLAFDRQAADGLRIEDGQASVVLRKHDGKWLLPESGDFPADQGAVERLLDELAGLQKGWPVATTAGAAKHFKLGTEGFERRLTVLAKDQILAELYVGTAPGFRKVHVRRAGEDAVYAVDFNAWEANAKADDWIDREILKLSEGDIERIELAGVVLQREGDALEVANLADGQETNAQEATTLLSRLAGLRIQSLLGSEPKPAYGQDAPAFELKLTRTGGEVLSYRFSKPEEGDYYVLKRSDLEDYFAVPEITVKAIADAKRDRLVTAKAEAMPGDGAPAAAAAPTPESDAPKVESAANAATGADTADAALGQSSAMPRR